MLEETILQLTNYWVSLHLLCGIIGLAQKEVIIELRMGQLFLLMRPEKAVQSQE